MRAKAGSNGWALSVEGLLRARALWVTVLLVVVLACLAPASALSAYVPQSPFGSPGAGDGGLELIAPNLGVPPRTAGSGLAVNDTTHNVYVGDTDNHRVTVFAADGDFVGAFGADVGGVGVDACSISCVAGTPGTTPGAFEAPTFVAVDNSASPSSGNVYVVDSAGTDNVISKFEADGTLVGSWDGNGQLSGDGSETFGQIGGIAVDSVGALDVFRAAPAPRNIFKFEEDGTFDEKFLSAGSGSPGGLGIDSSGNFFKTEGTPRVQKLNPDGTEIGRVTASTANAGFAVDSSSGELFVVRTTGVVDLYAFPPCVPAPSPFLGCAPAETLPPGGLTEGGGLAVDSVTHTVYAADPSADQITPFAEVNTPTATTKPANPVGAESATLNGEVNPNGAPLTECFFEWGETEAYGEIADCEDPDFEEVGEGPSFVPVHADIEGLEPSTIYHFKLVNANADGSAEGDDEEFTTLGPTIKAESVSQVTATDAKIAGEIDPNGKATSFLVQYVTEAQFLANGFTEAEQTAPQAIGSGTAFKAVGQQLSGLDPQTAYRFRLVATNADATSFGQGGKFITFALPSTGLPDGRKYEMVSPPQKTGEVIPPEPSGNLSEGCGECLPGINVPTMPMQAALDGESVLYEGQPFSGGLAAGPNEYISARGSEEWSWQGLSTPVITGRYEAFSSDLSLGVLSQVDPALSPLAPVRGDKIFANLYLRDKGGSFEPLVTVEPPNRDPNAASKGDNRFRILYAAANAGSSFAPEFSHLLFEANDSLTDAVPGIAPAAPEVEGGDECTFAECNLYEWAGGELRLVNVLPGNASASSSAVFGSGRLLGSLETPNVDNTISDEGSRIFWSEEESGQVYVRVDGEKTLEVPGPGSCKTSEELEDRACFLTASEDGTAVLLSDGQLYELSEAGPEAYEPTADLTEGQGGFKGILGASGDLGRIYFVDTADLTGSEENDNGEEAEAGKFNLYAWEEGTSAFIGILLAPDNFFGLNFGAWRATPSHRSAQVSLDGRYLAFMSLASLTGYDNRLAGGGICTTAGGALCREVFIYEADSETLNCASCNPSGQRPLGPSNLSLLRPQAPFRQPVNLSKEGEGLLFFESQDALLPQDVNGDTQDVYQWKPEGAGSCEQEGGCLALISSGHAANNSMFLDSTPSGDDVFFITREQLLPRDKDEQLDLYDARVGGGFEETPIEICVGETCKGPISVPPVQRGTLPPFVGPDNPPKNPSCKKGFVKKKGKCVKKPKKKKKGKGQRRKRGGAR